MPALFKSPEEVIRKIRTVSSLPEVFERINTVANHPHSSLSDIAAVIADDVGLTARLLRLVNSAYYGFPSRIETITHACMIVGTQQIRHLAMATSVVDIFKSIDPDILDMQSFWRHSIATAMAARALAIRSGEMDIERFFIAGLLHDVGRLALVQAVPDEMGPLFLEARNPVAPTIQEIEKDLLGLSHSEVGGALLASWKLPPSLVNPVRYHHAPASCQAYPREAAATHWANIIAHAMDIGHSGNPLIPPASAAAWELLEITPDILASLTEELASQIDEMIVFFLGSPS